MCAMFLPKELKWDPHLEAGEAQTQEISTSVMPTVAKTLRDSGFLNQNNSDS